MKAPIDWLLSGPPWIEYRTRLDLLGQSESDAEVKAARKAMLGDAQVRGLVSELGRWPGKVIASHKSAGQPFHRLTFMADLGLRAGDPGVDKVLERVMAHQSEEGPFQLPMNIATGYGGTGKDQWAWALCDAPLLVYALIKCGEGDHLEVKSAAAYLTALVRKNGWPCAVSKKLGKFRGPGRKDDACPFATLAMVKCLGESQEPRDREAALTGAEALLELWRESTKQHPYMFYMGTDFRKLKVPFVWYDLMHVLEVLSGFPEIRKDKRLLEMLATMKRKADAEGRFALESIWTAWKDWEFGQKSTPSRWLTLMAWRIVGRAEGRSFSH